MKMLKMDVKIMLWFMYQQVANSGDISIKQGCGVKGFFVRLSTPSPQNCYGVGHPTTRLQKSPNSQLQKWPTLHS